MPDFLDYLQSQSVLAPDQLKATRSRMQRTGFTPEQTLLELQLVPEEQLYTHLASFHELDLCDLNRQQPSSEAVAKLPARLAARFHCVPIAIQHNMLLLAFTHAPSLTTISQLQLLVGIQVKPSLCRPSQFEQWQRQNYGITAENIQQLRRQRREAHGKASPAPSEEIADDSSEASIIRVVNEILDQALAAQATDVHLEPFRDSLRVRFRIDGMLRDVPTPPGLADLTESIISRIKVMAQLDIAEKRLPHDGRIRLLRHGEPCNLRVSLLPTRFGETLCLRLLDSSNLLLQTSELGLNPQQLKLLHRLVARPNGLILVTGPTGSGKTTTLYSVLAHLRDQHHGLKIITVEDPVEYEMAGLTQIQTHAEIGLTFATALRSILRHDPDIILIGEIRDQETAEIAIQSALTGHLVFSTLHTNDSVGAVSRLINMGVEPDLVAASLSCVIAQRLVRCLCPSCAETITALDSAEQAELTAVIQCAGLSPNDLHLRQAHPGGCTFCGHTGYRGRIAIYEFLLVSEDLEDLICNRAPTSELRHNALQNGLRSFREDGWLKVASGITSADEINRVTLPPKN